MATVSSAGGGSAMGNAQQSTRGLSAGDWIRLQRLRGARNNGLTGTDGVLTTNKDIAPPAFAKVAYGPSFLIGKQTGTSKIRRPASNWTDFVASQTGDFVIASQTVNNGVNIAGVTNKRTTLCNCTTTTLLTKVGNCTKCNALGTVPHVRLS